MLPRHLVQLIIQALFYMCSNFSQRSRDIHTYVHTDVPHRGDFKKLGVQWPAHKLTINKTKYNMVKLYAYTNMLHT